MKTIFEICIFVILVGIPLQVYYWCAIRPVLLTKVEFEVCRLRKKLHELGLSTTREGKQAVPIIDKKCEGLLRFMDQFDMLRPVLATLPVEVKLRIERDREIISQAPAEIREVNKELEILAGGAAVFNSPGIVVLCLMFLPVVIFAALCCVATNRVKVAWESIIRRIRIGLYFPDHTVAC
jgi:hypothetical protein